MNAAGERAEKRLLTEPYASRISQLDRSKAAVFRVEMTHACGGELVLLVRHCFLTPAHLSSMPQHP